MQMPALLPVGYVQMSDVSWHAAPAKPPQSPRTDAHAFVTHSRLFGQLLPLHCMPIDPQAAVFTSCGGTVPSDGGGVDSPQPMNSTAAMSNRRVIEPDDIKSCTIEPCASRSL